MQTLFETAFDIVYLCTVITLGIIMICKINSPYFHFSFSDNNTMLTGI